MLTGIFAASRAGEFARVNPTLAGLIGRPPMSLRDFLRPAISPAE
jgi:NAD(P)H dehydrogenase (quinone)